MLATCKFIFSEGLRIRIGGDSHSFQLLDPYIGVVLWFNFEKGQDKQTTIKTFFTFLLRFPDLVYFE